MRSAEAPAKVLSEFRLVQGALCWVKAVISSAKGLAAWGIRVNREQTTELVKQAESNPVRGAVPGEWAGSCHTPF